MTDQGVEVAVIEGHRVYVDRSGLFNAYTDEQDRTTHLCTTTMADMRSKILIADRNKRASDASSLGIPVVYIDNTADLVRKTTITGVHQKTGALTSPNGQLHATLYYDVPGVEEALSVIRELRARANTISLRLGLAVLVHHPSGLNSPTEAWVRQRADELLTEWKAAQEVSVPQIDRHFDL